MFMADFMIGTDNRALEEAPDTLNGIGVDIATHPFLSTMVDGLMPRVVVSNSFVSRPIISVDSLSIRGNILVNKAMKCLASGIRDSSKSCHTQSYIYIP